MPGLNRLGISPRKCAGLRQCGNQAAPAKRRYRCIQYHRDGAAVAPASKIIRFNPHDRRHFIGGSDARIIMGDDEADLIQLWREKRGETAPQDFSQNLIVQLGTATEELNRVWYQRSTGQTSRTSRSGFVIPSTNGWPPRLTASSNQRARSSKPNSCCPGPLRKKAPPRNTWRSSSTTCGWPCSLGRAVDHHRWRQMGRDQDHTPIRSINTFC